MKIGLSMVKISECRGKGGRVLGPWKGVEKISWGGQKGPLLTCIPLCEVSTSSTRKGRTHQWTWRKVNQSTEKWSKQGI